MTEKREPLVEIFTDGACSGNPGKGGYGAILIFGKNTKEISGCALDTTNNRMELTAVIQALRQLKRPCRIRLFSDSSYVIKGMTEWLPRWVKRNWTNAQKNPVLNRDLWETLLKVSKPHKVEWIWVRGHHGQKENERCDKLARDAIRKCVAKKDLIADYYSERLK
jgi:ribonuclease HI